MDNIENQEQRKPLDKSALLTSLRNDLKSAEVLKNQWQVRMKEWRNQYQGLQYGNEQKGKSAIISRDIKKQSEWQHATIIDPFVSNDNVIKCDPVTWEDTEAARQNELLLNTQFTRKFDRFNFMTKAVKILDMEGTVVIQTGWDYQEEKIKVHKEVVMQDEFGNEYLEVQEVEDVIVKKNQPTAKVCRNEDIYLDPTCQDNLDNAQFVIYRYETDISTLRKDGRYKNLDKVAKMGDKVSYDYSYRPEDETRFMFADAARKKIVVYEYWGNYDVNDDGIAEPIVCAWVNDVIIRLQGNPYPDKKPPFLVVPFYSVPFQLHGEANAELIGDNQKVKTAILRGFIDNMAQSNNGQVGIHKGALDPLNRKKYLEGRNFEFNGTPNDFWQGSYNQIPQSAFNMLELMNNEIESLTGVKSFSGGINANSLGATATGARGALDATSTRRLNIVRNIAENLVKPLMRKWMTYNAEFLSEEEVVRVTNEQFVPIRRDDLSGQIDISITVSTAEDNAAKVQQLSFLLQTLGPNEDPQIRRHIMATIYELNRMPQDAKLIREFQPQQDPMAEEMKKLQLEKVKLENALMQSEILRNRARAGEDEIDRVLKQQKIEVEAAKARTLNSRADLDDLKFVDSADGKDIQSELAKLQAKHQQEMEKLVASHKSQMDTLAFNAMQKDKDRAQLDRHTTETTTIDSMHKNADRHLDNLHRHLDRKASIMTSNSGSE